MNTKLNPQLLLQPLLETTAGREALYRLIQFTIKLLSPINKTYYGKVIYFLLNKINWNIGIARHINRFGILYKLILSLFLNSASSSDLALPSNDKRDYFKTVSSISFCLFCLIDHVILFSKIQVFKSIPINKLYYISGIFWFIGNTSTVASYINSNKNKPLTKRDMCNLIKCLCDYVILFHFSTKENLLPNWICGLFGVLSSSLSIYSKYMIKE